jgi:hypothetical protein
MASLTVERGDWLQRHRRSPEYLEIEREMLAALLGPFWKSWND